MKKSKLIVLLIFLGIFSCKNNDILVDPQGNVYSVVEVGNNIWTNENLNLDIAEESFCYNEDLNECDTMGRLYTWEGAINAAKSIPGWHLPSKSEWNELIEIFGGDSLAFQNIMNLEDGFKPQAAGVRLSNGYYVAKKFKGVNYWSSTIADTSVAHAYSVAFMNHIGKLSPHNYPVDNACSIRLVKDK